MDAELWYNKVLSLHMNSILVEAWDAFKLSSRKFIRYIFVKTKLLPLRPPDLTTDTQAFDSSVQVSYGAKAEEINKISRCTVAPIDLQLTRTDFPMVFLQQNVSQKISSNIVLQYSSYDAVRKLTVIPIQEINI